jgi:hypothetical protein
MLPGSSLDANMQEIYFFLLPPLCSVMQNFRLKVPVVIKATSLFAAATFSLGGIAPAQAAPVDCQSGFGGTWIINGSGGLSNSNGAMPTDGCYIGDKLYSDFSFTGISTGNFAFTNAIPLEHIFSGSGLGFVGSSFSYTYKVALYNPAPGTVFYGYRTGASASGGAGSVYSKTLKSTSPASTPISSVSTNGADGVQAIFPSGTISPITFESTVTRTSGGTVDVITDSIEQKQIPPVPGPLPIFGAGAAFAFSRRLRNRIKQAV